MVGNEAKSAARSSALTAARQHVDQSCITLIECCSLSPYCESTSEEPSAGNLHAGFCGSRRWATASGHPVGVGAQ